MKPSVVLDIDLKMLSKVTYPWFFFYRVARILFLVTLPTLFLILFIYRSSYKEGLISQMNSQIEESLKTTSYSLSKAGINPTDWCNNLPTPINARYSLINAKGEIICDTLKEKSHKFIKNMSEVNESFKREYSSSVRFSKTFSTLSLFASLKITDDLALRKVIPISSLKGDLGRFDRILFWRIIPFALLSYLIFLLLFYQATKPLGSILSKVESFKVDIPFKKNLELLYKHNEWAQIEEALNETELKMKDQVRLVKTENEKIGAILESIHDSIIAIDTYESILFFNSKFKKNFINDRDKNEIISKIWHHFSEENVLNAFRLVLKNGEVITLRGIHFTNSLAPERFFDLTITPLKGPDQKISGALGVFYDVTEFKLTEQMRVDFVANVSHEIRTPLTSIKGYAQILESQKQKVDPSLQVFLEKIVSNTERMISLFNDLLHLSVIESKNIFKFEILNLTEIIESIADNIITNYPQKKIIFKSNINLKEIRGDQRLIEQVISNLIDNACKYSDDELELTISSSIKDDKALIIVQDNGHGISREHLQRIFERFYRIDSSRETLRGTGLGLSIVKHIIQKHGGKIWAESQEGHGTSFVIELPRT